MPEDMSWFIWVRMLCGCAAAYYVNKDAKKNEVPYRNFWVIFCFMIFPLVLVYHYYKGYIKRKGKISNLAQRELELQQKHLEAQQRLKAERDAWELERQKQQALNSEADKKLQAEIAQAKKERDAAHKKRMKELAEERELQQEAAAKALHFK